tara:strand:- start:62 stop:436 length:375 start_codon:yes stop_codon:yes gene_type:complete
MYKTKEQIQDRITLLETYVTDSNNAKINYAAEIDVLKRDLADINKPVINDSILSDIYAIIETHIEDINDIDPSDCEFDFDIDREGMVSVDSMQILKPLDYAAEALYNELKSLFKVTEEEDEDSV